MKRLESVRASRGLRGIERWIKQGLRLPGRVLTSKYEPKVEGIRRLEKLGGELDLQGVTVQLDRGFSLELLVLQEKGLTFLIPNGHISYHSFGNVSADIPNRVKSSGADSLSNKRNTMRSP